MADLLGKLSLLNTTRLLLLVLLLGVCGRILLGLQGIDSLDAGYSQVFYMAIFDNPDGNAFNFVHLTVGIIGGMIEQLIPSGGMLASRIVEALCIATAILSLSVAFRPFVSRRYLLPLTAMLCICYPTIIVSLHYNTATYMFFSIAILCLSKALLSGKQKWIFDMGFAYVLALGCRITNAATAPLLLLPLTYFYKKNKNISAPLIIFSFGAISSALLLLLIVYLFSDINSMMSGIADARSFANSEDATHSLPNLIFSYLLSSKNWILQILIIYVLHRLYLAVSTKTQGKTKTSLTVLLFIGFLVNVWTSNSFLCILALGLYITACSLKKQPVHGLLQDEQFVLCAFSILAAIILPFGSDTGFSAFHWLIGLVAFPACTYIKTNNKTLVILLFAGISVIAVTMNLSRMYDSFNKNRLKATTWSDINKLNLFVTKEQYDFYDYHTSLINKYKKDSKYMLLGSQQSMFYYITKTYPFTGHSMPTVYTGDALYNRLESQKERLNELPFVYIIKTDTDANEINDCILKWMKQYDYQPVYKDNTTVIYRTKQND